MELFLIFFFLILDINDHFSLKICRHLNEYLFPFIYANTSWDCLSMCSIFLLSFEVWLVATSNIKNILIWFCSIFCGNKNTNSEKCQWWEEGGPVHVIKWQDRITVIYILNSCLWFSIHLIGNRYLENQTWKFNDCRDISLSSFKAKCLHWDFKIAYYDNAEDV